MTYVANYYDTYKSVIISDGEADDSVLSDENLSPTQSRKKLVKHMKQWRSDEFQSYNIDG